MEIKITIKIQKLFSLQKKALKIYYFDQNNCSIR